MFNGGKHTKSLLKARTFSIPDPVLNRYTLCIILKVFEYTVPLVESGAKRSCCISTFSDLLQYSLFQWSRLARIPNIEKQHPHGSLQALRKHIQVPEYAHRRKGCALARS